MIDSDTILKTAADQYLESRDFNGYPCHTIMRLYDIKAGELRPILHKLVENKKITLEFGDRHANPHIKAFRNEPIESQLKKLANTDFEHVCIYPTPEYLEDVVKKDDFAGQPYTLELALGTGQLEFRTFDLSVLEVYRNDPRYYYENDDIRGKIGVRNEYYTSSKMPEKDQILLKTFGFAYDDDFNRAVAAFCCYLSNLSPEHQQIWKSKEIKGNYKLHPDYFRNCILGDWGQRVSIFNAFIEELKIINKMCDVMGRPHLFRKDFQDHRPRNFSFLVRPTLEEYNSFTLTLDKMMSDNINKKFFMDDVSDELEEEREDGKIVVRSKGTITMLEEWLNDQFSSAEGDPVKELIDTFKSVRDQRQKPAHSLKPDEFNQKYFHAQRELIIKAYDAIRLIRLIFANHPWVRVADVKIPALLYRGMVWNY